MKKTTVVFISLIALLCIQACSNTKTAQLDLPASTKNIGSAEAVTLDKAYFENRLITEDDIEKNTVIISTINGFHKKPRNNTNAWANNYITALIDKTTGNITYQINSLIQYKDHDKHLYKEVSYNTSTAHKTKEAFILSHEISCLGSAYSGCMHTEHVTFTIDSILLTEIASRYTEESNNKWRYKLSPKNGRSYSAHLFIAEISALVEAAREHKTL
jgi:hypothetical protein